MSTRAVKQKLNELLTASENGNVAVIDKVSKLKLKRKALKEKKKAAKAAKATPSTKATDNLQRNLQYLERTNTPSIEQQELLQKVSREVTSSCCCL